MSDVVDTVMALVMVVVVGAIGIFIADQVVTQTTVNTPYNATNGNFTGMNVNLSGMYTDILSAGETGSGFIVILIIAFIGGLAISYMFGLIGRKKQR